MTPETALQIQGIPSESDLRKLVAAFYSDVRTDPLLGPIFSEKIVDWDGHVARVSDFWSSVMLGSGRYSGNPFRAHLPLQERLAPEHFERWLMLWGHAARRILEPSAAAHIEQRAHRIAKSLEAGLLFRPDLMPTPPRPASAEH